VATSLARRTNIFINQYFIPRYKYNYSLDTKLSESIMMTKYNSKKTKFKSSLLDRVYYSFSVEFWLSIVTVGIAVDWIFKFGTDSLVITLAWAGILGTYMVFTNRVAGDLWYNFRGIKAPLSNDSDIGEWRQRSALSFRSIRGCRDSYRSIVRSIASQGFSCVDRCCHWTNDSIFDPRADRCLPANCRVI
jgi:hypothetical protein